MRRDAVIAHADMDAFYASVEQLDDARLRHRAVAVGSTSRRGVVLAASYEARRYGIRSAMPMAEALRRCPTLLRVAPRFERYVQASRQIMAVFDDFSPHVEPLSLDEAFIDMTGAAELFGSPRKIAASIKSCVYDATSGLTVSVGVAATKYVAKVASDHDKPDGLTVVDPADTREWLNPLPVERLWGAGPKTVKRMHRIGLFYIGDIQRADTSWLMHELGSAGVHFQALALGQDPRRVATRLATSVARRSVARSMGCDRTLSENVSSYEVLSHQLRRAADHLGVRLRRQHIVAGGVKVKLKSRYFEVMTRQAALSTPTQSSAQLFQLADQQLRQLLCQINRPSNSDVAFLESLEQHRAQHDSASSVYKRPTKRSPAAFRLIGLGVFDLAPADCPRQLALFDIGVDGEIDSACKAVQLEKTMDAVNNKFGAGKLVRARHVSNNRAVHSEAPDLDFLDTATDWPLD